MRIFFFLPENIKISTAARNNPSNAVNSMPRHCQNPIDIPINRRTIPSPYPTASLVALAKKRKSRPGISPEIPFPRRNKREFLCMEKFQREIPKIRNPYICSFQIEISFSRISCILQNASIMILAAHSNSICSPFILFFCPASAADIQIPDLGSFDGSDVSCQTSAAFAAVVTAPGSGNIYGASFKIVIYASFTGVIVPAVLVYLFFYSPQWYAADGKLQMSAFPRGVADTLPFCNINKLFC